MDGPLREVRRPRTVDKPTVPIVRCDATARYNLKCLVLSEDVFGVEVHYAGRTVPCPGADRGCRYCEIDRPTRWVGYVAATDTVARQKRWLVELTAGVMGEVDAWHKSNGTLRGLWAELTRPSHRPTGRLQIELKRLAVVLPEELPKPFDVRAALARIWKGSLEGGLFDEDRNACPSPGETRPGGRLDVLSGNGRVLPQS